MPFTVISGSFHLVGKTPTGKPSGFEPDGDSIQFAPDDTSLLDKLPVLDQPVRLSSIGSTQLRMEGIDALELHFQPTVAGAGNAYQPKPLAEASRDALVKALGLGPVSYAPPNDLRVVPPAAHDGARGWIATRSLDVHGRPVSFVYSGAAPKADGTSLTLTPPMLRKSLNYRQLATGNAYPLFYDTLFASLRAPLTSAAVQAYNKGLGIWAQDETTSGTNGATVAALERTGVIFPKLFRRLVEYHAEKGDGLGDFLPWLASKKEQVLDLATSNFTHLDNVVAVSGRTVKLTSDPERLVFVSDKGKVRPNQ